LVIFGFFCIFFVSLFQGALGSLWKQKKICLFLWFSGSEHQKTCFKKKKIFWFSLYFCLTLPGRPGVTLEAKQNFCFFVFDFLVLNIKNVFLEKKKFLVFFVVLSHSPSPPGSHPDQAKQIFDNRFRFSDPKLVYDQISGLGSVKKSK